MNEWISLGFGTALLLVGASDIFFTVLHYDNIGFLSCRLYGGLFRAIRWLTAPLPRRFRAFGLSLGAPLMIPATVSLWIFLATLGFAFIYHAGMNRATFAFASGLEPSFQSALYISGVCISTLGLGDIAPRSGIYQALVVGEALIGFGILTLAIAYVLGVYAVLQRLSELSATLLHQAQDTANPWSILVPHFPDGEPRALESHLIELHRSLVSLHEGMRRYPIVYHFHSQRAYRSIPYAFRMIGGMATALRWGLPTGHSAVQTPYLPTLLTGLDTITSYVDDRFLSHHLPPVPESVSFETFAASFEDGEEPKDAMLGHFLEMEAFMRGLAKLEGLPQTKEAYLRYTEWLPFAHHNWAFWEATARDLGYERREITQGPGNKLF